MDTSVEIKAIYLSPGHDFFGRHDQGRADHGLIEVDQVNCVAGRGLEGDRFFDFKPNYKGQVTFFDWAVYEAIQDALQIPPFHPGAFRRNIIMSGVDLNSLIGRHFRIGEIEFEGTQESSPCYWMDEAIAPGAKDWLKDRGGLRARILSTGVLASGTNKCSTSV